MVRDFLDSQRICSNGCLTRLLGDYYFLVAGNELLQMNVVNCSGSVITNSTGGGSSSPGGSNSTSNSSYGSAYSWTLLCITFGLIVAHIVL